jgi:hypothetical protein
MTPPGTPSTYTVALEADTCTGAKKRKHIRAKGSAHSAMLRSEQKEFVSIMVVFLPVVDVEVAIV